MKKRLALLACCLMAVNLFAQNLWNDPDLEKTGTEIANAHSGKKAIVFKGTGDGKFLGSKPTLLKVEPYALYKATAWVRRDKDTDDDTKALFFYDWDSFGWSHMFNVRIPACDEWKQVTVNFYTGIPTVTLHPLVFERNQKRGQAFIDDIEIVRILSPEEHIAKLMAKPKTNGYEEEVIARYLIEKKDFEALEKLFAKATPGAKADIACMLAKMPEKSPDIVKNVARMIQHGGLNAPEGTKRLSELFSKMSKADAFQSCFDAIQGGNVKSVVKALNILTAKWQTFKDGYCSISERLALNKNLQTRLNTTNIKEYKDFAGKLTATIDELASCLGSRTIVLCTTALTTANTAIILPNEPTESEEHAAHELANFLEQITGKFFQIVNENAAKPEHAIIIGRNMNLKDYGFNVDYKHLGLEGIHIESKGGHLLLAGGQRGVLYAVYTFLEEQLNCHWFTPDYSVIPNVGSLKLGKFQKVFVPVLEYRDTDYPVCRPPEFGVRNKLNGLYSKADAKWGEHISYCGFVHTMNGLIPPKIYGESHPEYFAERNGRRIATEQSQPCLTNPEVLAIAKKSLRERMEKNPKIVIFSVSQNDNQNFCQCKNCMALAEKEGSQAGPLLHFVNALARDVAKDYPDKIIDTLAYQYTRKPPKYVKPEPNVAIRLCSIECCFAHPLESDPFNSTFVTDIRGWQKVCNRLHIWDYVINYPNCVMPFPNFRVLKPNINFFIANGVTGIYEEANYFSKGGELSELRSYVLAKLLWDASYDTERAIFEFTEAYYGAAGKYIREYIKRIHDHSCNREKPHITIWVAPSVFLNDAKLLSDCEELFKKAEAAVANDDTKLHRVNVAHLPLIYTRHETTQTVMIKKGNHFTHAEIDNSDLDFFERVADREGLTKLKEGWSTDSYHSWLDKNRTTAKEATIVTLVSDKIKLDVIPGFGGRIWKGQDVATGKEIIHFVGDEKNGYSPTNSGYEEYAYYGYRAEGWATNFKIIESGKDFIVMQGEMRDGTISTRRIELLKDKVGFKVDTQYTAKQNLPARQCRLHPEFSVPDPWKATIFTKQKDGTVKNIELSMFDTEQHADNAEFWMQESLCPAGEWGFRYPSPDGKGTVTLVNTFDTTATRDCYIHCSRSEQRINLEQWTFPLPLTPTSGPRFSNTYVFSVR